MTGFYGALDKRMLSAPIMRVDSEYPAVVFVTSHGGKYGVYLLMQESDDENDWHLYHKKGTTPVIPGSLRLPECHLIKSIARILNGFSLKDLPQKYPELRFFNDEINGVWTKTRLATRREMAQMKALSRAKKPKRYRIERPRRIKRICN